MANFGKAPYNVGYCKVCGLPWPLPDLQKDGERHGLYVCPDCWDEDHPQKYPLKDVHDPIALRRPWIEPGAAPNYLTDTHTTPPYPARAQESLGSALVVGGGTLIQWHVDELEIGGDIQSITLTQVYFPLDYTYRRDDGEDFESLDLAGDITAIQLGTVYFPRDYIYRRDDGEPVEELEVAGDIISIVLGQEVLPVEYLNWPVEAVEVSGDITSITLGPP